MKQYKTRLPKISLVKEKSEYKNVKITSSKIAADYVKQFYHDDIELYESCFILLLNRANNTIGYAKISQGGIIGTVVDIRLICKYVIESLAMGVILVHNHPTGNLNPSDADRLLTRNLKKALEVFDVGLLDHLILTPNNGYTSFGDSGLL